ncbi:MAG TPA: hypothetical protein VL098_03890 [Flavipsychrobacter sp.]|nr:hypothetical protein [Flavipsychrobacter sp.]
MKDQLKYFPVNWIDGMKINKNHFIAQDNAWNNALADTAALNLSPVHFGVLPASVAGEDNFSVSISVDNQGTLRASVRSCQAVTSGGVRISLPSSAESNSDGVPAASFDFKVSGSEAVYWIVLTANPFERIPAGSPDVSEDPPRYPNVIPSYKLQVISASQYGQFAGNPYALTVGKVRVNGNDIRVDEEYIPPTYSVSANPDLLALHGELDHYLSTLELRSTQIVQKIFKKSQQNDLSELVMFLCDRVMLFIGQTITDFRWSAVHDTPAKLFSSIAGLSRVMKNTIDLRIGSGKEELMNYLSEWCDLNQGELENLFTTVANMRYDNNDINSNIGDTVRFVKVTGKLFDTLANLEFIGKRKDSGIFVKEEPRYSAGPAQQSNVEQPKPKRRFFGS